MIKYLNKDLNKLKNIEDFTNKKLLKLNLK